MKEKLMHHYVRALQTLSESEMKQFFQGIVDKMKGNFHTEINERIKTHQKDGYYTMIVSGAFTPLLEIVNQAYQMNALIGTNIPSANNPLDHVHAERKTSLIKAFMKDHTINWTDSYAYGDSLSDLSVLELVGHPVAVAPDQELEHIAQQRNWEIIR